MNLLFNVVLRVLMKKKSVCNRRKSFYSEKCGETLFEEDGLVRIHWTLHV